MIVEYEHPTAGSVRTLGLPIQFNGTPGDIRRPAPLLGEHTDEILSEFGGYSSAEIAALHTGRSLPDLRGSHLTPLQDHLYRLDTPFLGVALSSTSSRASRPC